MPILGIASSSNQTVQRIKSEQSHSDPKALLYSIAKLYPSFQVEAVKHFPELSNMFDYNPPNPLVEEPQASRMPLFELDEEAQEDVLSLDSLVSDFSSALQECGIHTYRETVLRFLASLLTKPFVILTGLSGSGKSKLAHAFASWITPRDLPPDPFFPGKCIQGTQESYVVHKSNSGIVELTCGNNELVALPRSIIEEWASYIETCNITNDISARELRQKVEKESRYSPHLHQLESYYKLVAFALVESRRAPIKANCFEMIPVGADWMGKEHLLGYPDFLRPSQGNEPGSYVTTPSLDLVRSALIPDRAAIPHVLILDEMNLSHVERYFADFLSAMESGEAIPLHTGSPLTDKSGGNVQASICIPANLFVIGTVNIDETTYMFSPKVLDRANVIEFTVSKQELVGFLESPSAIDLSLIRGAGQKYGRLFTAEGACKALPVDQLSTEIREKIRHILTELFETLAPIGGEFGYRAAYEILRFVCSYAGLSGPDWELFKALDAAIAQKLLPKLHGSKTKLGPVIEALQTLITATDYPITHEKLTRMTSRLNQNGFTSFAEA